MKVSQDEVASRLPSKLFNKLMPFQKEGVQFAVRKNGRYSSHFISFNSTVNIR